MRATFCASFLIATPLCIDSSASTNQTSATESIPGEAIVVFKSSSSPKDAEKAMASQGSSIAKRYRCLSALRKQQITLVHAPGRTTAEILAELRRDPHVESAEPNYVRRPFASYTPDDPRYADLWAFSNTGQTVNGTACIPGADIAFPQAWPLSRTPTTEVVVAVIDTGCDYRHPDLVDNMWRNPAEIPDNQLDDDANGWIDDIHGYDFASAIAPAAIGDPDPMDAAEHGTHVCGTIAATGNNGAGVIGVNSRARIMILKVSTDGLTMPESAILDAYDYVATMRQRGINIVAVNASYGGGGYSATEASAIALLGSLGVVFCGAAGNSGSNNDTSPNYPASYALSNILAVAATNPDDTLASFSNYGITSVDLAAPGYNILSCRPTQSTQVLTTAFVISATTNYSATGLSYAGTTTGITAMLYDCAYGAVTSFPAQVSNNIALIQRGPSSAPLTFAAKVANAKSAGALAAIIYNNVTGTFLGTLQSSEAWIPAVSLSRSDGLTLATTTGIVTVVNRYDPTAVYRFMSGTSMATPHVAGAASFLAMNFPEETATQRIARIMTNTRHLANLTTKVKSGGRLDMQRAIDTDSDGLPDWWERIYFGGYTNANPYADANEDAASNLAAWEAGTSPTYRPATISIFPLTAGTAAVPIQWASQTGNQYRVARSTNLLDGSPGFVPIAENIPATPPSNTYTDSPPPSAPSSFYRIELQPLE